ncbi:MAG: winged helix-turn-helix domain-containing protein [Desulfovibrionaceae bacterium]
MDQIGQTAGPEARPARDAGSAPAAPAVSRATLRLHLWLEAEEGMVFGMGRLLLLEQVARCGSLKAAAEQMNMSYRAAWGKIKATEQVLGRALIEKGRGNHGRYQLTAYGRELMDSFAGLFREVEAFAVARGSRMLPFALTSFDDGVVP